MGGPVQTPLVERLRHVPEQAAHNYRVSWCESVFTQYGRLCHEAAQRIEELEAALIEATPPTGGES